jgi:hypothetical protein
MWLWKLRDDYALIHLKRCLCTWCTDCPFVQHALSFTIQIPSLGYPGENLEMRCHDFETQGCVYWAPSSIECNQLNQRPSERDTATNADQTCCGGG